MQPTHTYIMCVMPGVNGEGDTFTLHPAPPTDAQMVMRTQQQHTENCVKRYTKMASNLLAARAHENWAAARKLASKMNRKRALTPAVLNLARFTQVLLLTTVDQTWMCGYRTDRKRQQHRITDQGTDLLNLLVDLTQQAETISATAETAATTTRPKRCPTSDAWSVAAQAPTGNEKPLERTGKYSS